MAERYSPEFQQGLANLAQMFAPPSAQEHYAYSQAGLASQKTKTLADLYAYAQDPNFDREQFERRAVAGGMYVPTQSYYAVDQTQQTSRQNNAADNTRALQQTGMQQAGELQRTMLAPVAEGATRFVPKTIADMFGVPEQQVGAVSASQGEKVVTPDGRTIMGAPKPLSKTEVEAQILSSLPPEIQRAVTIGNTPVQEVVGPDGKPQIAFQADSVGKQPFVKQAGQPQTTNYRAPDGKSGTAVYDPIMGWKDTQTGQPLAQGSQTFDLKAQGTLSEVGLAPTTANNTSANSQSAEITRQLAMLDIYQGILDNNPGVVGLPGVIRGTAQNAIAATTDMARAFGRQAPEMEAAAADLRNGLRGVAPEYFDPNIPEAQFLQGALAYGLARTENPSGEVSRQAYERALERIQGGGLLANNQSAKAQIDAFRKILQTQLQGVNVLRDPATARTDVRPQNAGPQIIQTPAGPVTIQKVQ